MPPDLSMQMPDKAADRRFFAESGSKFEPFVIKTLCEPLLPHIPASVHPNAISLMTHCVVWVTACLAVSSVHMSRLGQALALIGAGIGMFISMLGDCIDGLHARRTNQCTKLGELMDHWLDAIVVPLATVGITCALQLPPWAMVAVNVTASMVYNAQLVLYHHTGRFVHPEAATGVEGQFGLSLGYIGLAGFFFYIDRNQPWLDMAMAALAVAGVIVQMRCNYFYYPKLGRTIVEHLHFVVLLSGFGVLYLLGAIGLHFFLLALVFTSFRVSGTYVLKTIVKERYTGNDLGLLAFIAAIFAVHYGTQLQPVAGLSVENALTLAACAYAFVRNMFDFAQRFRTLHPITQPTTRDA
jgi:phosphatidylglycerophosphate synthase